MTAYKLYGDGRSGNCLKAKWTGAYTGLPVEWVGLDIMNGDSRTEAFLKINPFGQVPTLVGDDGIVVTQSNAIIVYLAEISGSSLLPTAPALRAKVFSWLFWEQNSHEPYIAGRRFRKSIRGDTEADIDAEWLPRGYAALDHMEAALAKNSYLVGDALTLADIAVVAYTRVSPEGGFDLSSYPRITAWVARVENDLNISPEEVA